MLSSIVLTIATMAAIAIGAPLGSAIAPPEHTAWSAQHATPTREPHQPSQHKEKRMRPGLRRKTFRLDGDAGARFAAWRARF